MAEQMTHWQRIRATIKGEATDRTPIALWKHWPPVDEIPERLAESTIGWQRAYDWDMVKLTPTGTYGIEDWGARTAWNPNNQGVRTVVQWGVPDPNNWPKLAQLNVRAGYIGNQIKALELLARELGDSAPILHTVFSPLTTARKLAGDRIFEDLRTRPHLFKQGLQVIADTTLRFCLECLKSGAHGIFFATQMDSHKLLSEAEFEEFDAVYDRQVLNGIRKQAEIILLHAHGEDLMFDQVARLPGDAINWHDRETPPSLAEGLPRIPGMAVGGISEWKTLVSGPSAAIEAEIHDAIRQAGGRRLMIGAGCVTPQNTPPEHVRAARQAVETYQG